MHWGLGLQVVCILNQQFLLCRFKVVRRHHIKHKRVEGGLLSIWGLQVFTYAPLQRPGVISLFLAALTKPSVMRFKLHHSHGNFQLNVWGWMSGVGGNLFWLVTDAFLTFSLPLPQRERIVEAIIQIIWVKMKNPGTQIPRQWRWFWLWMTQDVCFSEWV